MQVERSVLFEASADYRLDSGELVSNTWVTYPLVRDNSPKGLLIPGILIRSHGWMRKDGLCLQAITEGGACGSLASW